MMMILINIYIICFGKCQRNQRILYALDNCIVLTFSADSHRYIRHVCVNIAINDINKLEIGREDVKVERERKKR